MIAIYCMASLKWGTHTDWIQFFCIISFLNIFTNGSGCVIGLLGPLPPLFSSAISKWSDFTVFMSSWIIDMSIATESLAISWSSVENFAVTTKEEAVSGAMWYLYTQLGWWCILTVFLIICTSKWLSYVNVISQLHVDMETELSVL